MIRNLKMLGLAVVAMLALAVVGASAASAAEFHSEASSTILSGAQAASFNDKFTVDAGTTECENTSYSGSQTGATTTTSKAAPSYSGCTSTFGVSVTVDPNGCEYQFHTNGNTYDILCPSGKVIEVTAPGCTITVPPQEGRTGVSFSTGSSGGKKDVTVAVDSTNQIRYEEHNKGFFPTCKTNTGGLKSNGSYTGQATVTGSSGGSAVGIWYE